MSDNNTSYSEYLDCKLCCTGADLDNEGYQCDENLNADKEFIGDNNDFDLLSDNAPKLSDWKTNGTHVSVEFNKAEQDMHGQLETELFHVANKLK